MRLKEFQVGTQSNLQADRRSGSVEHLAVTGENRTKKLICLLYQRKIAKKNFNMDPADNYSNVNKPVALELKMSLAIITFARNEHAIDKDIGM